VKERKKERKKEREKNIEVEMKKQTRWGSGGFSVIDFFKF